MAPTTSGQTADEALFQDGARQSVASWRLLKDILTRRASCPNSPADAEAISLLVPRKLPGTSEIKRRHRHVTVERRQRVQQDRKTYYPHQV